MDAMTLLEAVLEATEHYENDERYAGRWGNAFTKIINAHGLKPGLLGDARQHDVTTSQIDELIDRDYLRELSSADSSIDRKFAITDRGRRAARDMAEQTGPDAVDLRWPSVAPRLQAFVTAYELAQTPRRGIREPVEPAAVAHFRELVRTDFIEETEFSVDAVSFYRPTEKGLRVTRAWLTPDAESKQLAEAIATAIETSEDRESQTLRDAIRAGRGFFVDVIAKTLAEMAASGR
jgi:DNA-binding PadR family transcriptional regulator